MTDKYDISVVAIKPNGELAGYYAKMEDVHKVLKGSRLPAIMDAIKKELVYMGLKWMREEVYRDAYFAKRDLSFPVPEDYHTYLENPIRMTKEREEMEKEREMMAKRKEEQENTMSRMRKKREFVAEDKTEVKRSTRGMRVYCPETGAIYQNVKEASAEMGLSWKTLYFYLRSGDMMPTRKIHLKYIE